MSVRDTYSGKESLPFVGMCHFVLRQLPEGTEKQIAALMFAVVGTAAGGALIGSPPSFDASEITVLVS
jgi:hypothetical protein